MTYKFDDFCGDMVAILKAKGTEGLPEIAGKLEVLLRDPVWVEETFGHMEPGKRKLFHDPASDARIQAHVHEGNKKGPPHSHGASWAIYGTAKGFTAMKEWRRVNPESEDHAEIEVADSYRLGPGQARDYSPHMIHSTAHPDGAWVIRIIGTDLNAIPRFRFKADRGDKIIEHRVGA